MRVLIIPLSEEAYNGCGDVNSSGIVETEAGKLYGTMLEIDDAATAYPGGEIDFAMLESNDRWSEDEEEEDEEG